MDNEKFAREVLIKSKRLKLFGLNEYVLTALLVKEYYSISEAEQVIKDFIETYKEV